MQITTHMKNHTMPGIEYPPTDRLATTTQLPEITRFIQLLSASDWPRNRGRSGGSAARAHGRMKSMTPRMFTPERMSAYAWLMSSSGYRLVISSSSLSRPAVYRFSRLGIASRGEPMP